jgi:hypothetical protein
MLDGAAYFELWHAPELIVRARKIKKLTPVSKDFHHRACSNPGTFYTPKK